MEMLGRAQRAAVFKERTTMIATGDHEEEVNKRIAQVKAEGQATDSEFDREKAEERVAKLGGAIGRIKVGAATETELKDKKLRYEDALNSVKAAMDEGIVPGGGSTLVYMLRYKHSRSSIGSRPNPHTPPTHTPSAPLLQVQAADPRRDGERRREARRRHPLPRDPGETLVTPHISLVTPHIPSPHPPLTPPPLSRALQYPINQIAFNAGEEGALVLEKVKDKEFGYGWNAANGEYGDLFEMGVIDPATVTQQAIINSCSIAASVLTTNCLITEIREEEPPMMAGGGADPMGGMPGM